MTDAIATTLLKGQSDLLERVSLEGFEKNSNALRAVIQIHTFVQVNRGKSGLTKRCTECGFAYPCPTIEAIEKLLV